MSDQELIRGVITGDNSAMKEVILKYQDLVLNTCYKVLRSREDAEDIAQEVFLETYRSAASLRYEDDISFWLYRISLNKSINYGKRKRNIIFRSFMHIDMLLRQGEEESTIPISDEHPGENLEATEKREILARAIDSLPAMQKKVFILHHFEDLAYKDICKALNLSLSSVESLLFRAKANLKKKCGSFNTSEEKKRKK